MDTSQQTSLVFTQEDYLELCFELANSSQKLPA